MRRLLFLNGIKAFEAAARSGGFAAFRRWIIGAAAGHGVFERSVPSDLIRGGSGSRKENASKQQPAGRKTNNKTNDKARR